MMDVKFGPGGPPVVIAENDKGFPVREAPDGILVTVATNGRGYPIVVIPPPEPAP